MRKRKEADPVPLGSLLGKEIRLLAKDRGLPPNIGSAWRKAVGEHVARRAVPMKIHKGKLYVRAATSTWVSEICLLAPIILDKLRKSPGCADIEELHLEVGTIPARATPSTRHDLPQPPPCPQGIRDAVEALEDPEMRRTAKNAVEACRRRHGSKSSS